MEFVVFTNTIEFRISDVYMGGLPLAEHDSMPPLIANTAAGNVSVGGTNPFEKKKKGLQSRTSTNDHIFVPADSPYIPSYFKLFTTVTTTKSDESDL